MTRRAASGTGRLALSSKSCRAKVALFSARSDSCDGAAILGCYEARTAMSNGGGAVPLKGHAPA